MALEFSRSTILSTDKRYFFLEDNTLETDGFEFIKDVLAMFADAEVYDLGYDTDPRWWLIPGKLLTFNTTETENEE